MMHILQKNITGMNTAATSAKAMWSPSICISEEWVMPLEPGAPVNKNFFYEALRLKINVGTFMSELLSNRISRIKKKKLSRAGYYQQSNENWAHTVGKLKPLGSYKY